jgi:hypothetical protein
MMQAQFRMELFRRHGEVRRFLIMRGDVIHGYLGYNTTAIQKQLVGTSLLITKTSGKGTYVTDSI